MFLGSDYKRKRGFTVRFSISGWTLPAPVASSVELLYDIETSWVEGKTPYKIDRYNGFKLTLSVPINAPALSYSNMLSGSLGKLKVIYTLSKEFLPYSWLNIKVPKANKNYERLESSHVLTQINPSIGDLGKIKPIAFFTTVSATSVTLYCRKTLLGNPDGQAVDQTSSIHVVWAPDLSHWNEDEIFIMFAEKNFDKSKCDFIRFEIPNMKTPPNTKLLPATFKTKIMTNRSFDKNFKAGEQWVEATPTKPAYLIEELVDVTASVLLNTGPKVIDGEYTND